MWEYYEVLDSIMIEVAPELETEYITWGSFEPSLCAVSDLGLMLVTGAPRPRGRGTMTLKMNVFPNLRLLLSNAIHQFLISFTPWLCSPLGVQIYADSSSVMSSFLQRLCAIP